ncbi:hypothetical protein SEA_BIG4_188 [Microbacterium phage Big4]|nr:hypothetical protein SEA_BIG4_188 [Microbacterium phage Big4]
MTDQNEKTDDSDLGFTDTPDPYQARNGRREALQAALHLMGGKGEAADATLLVTYASQIDAYLEDGSIPERAEIGQSGEEIATRVRGILDRDLGGAQSIHR